MLSEVKSIFSLYSSFSICGRPRIMCLQTVGSAARAQVVVWVRWIVTCFVTLRGHRQIMAVGHVLRWHIRTDRRIYCRIWTYRHSRSKAIHRWMSTRFAFSLPLILLCPRKSPWAHVCRIYTLFLFHWAFLWFLILLHSRHKHFK